MALRRWTLQLFRWTSLWLVSTALWIMVLCVDSLPSCPRSCSCPALREVHCTFRHLTYVPKSFPRDTQRLNLGYNSLTEVEGSEIRSLRQLEMLMLHGNDIETIQDGAFYGLRALQILKLSYNKLTSVRSGLFEGLVGLVRLHLDHNLISFIEPYSFSGLTSLKLLQLEGNLLKEIHPHTFITVSVLGQFWSSGLKHLHLSENLLERLPSSSLSSAPRLELLTLHANPWVCDCSLRWLVHWGAEHQGVVKCKKDRDSGSVGVCPQCSSPWPLNSSNLLDLTPDQLTCERPAIKSHFKLWNNPLWSESESEPDVPYTRDFENSLGKLTFVLSDSHSNHAHVACDVRKPAETSLISWSTNSQTPDDVSVNVTLVTALECEIDRESLQNLWQLVAYYYESPAILERGQLRGNTSTVTYQYTQVINDNSPYFTELKGYMSAEPSWLLQPRVTLKLNRPQTTTKKLVMDFTTVITKNMNSYTGQEEDRDITSSWAMIRKGGNGHVQTALEGSKVKLDCNVIASEPQIKVEWMLPDMSILENSNNKIEITQNGELVILNVTLLDSGVYHCMIKTIAGVDLVPFRVTIKEKSLSPKAFNGKKFELEKGDSLTLPCNVTSAQPSQTLWYLPKNQILLPTQQTRHAQVMNNGTLVVKKVTSEDAGEYSCLASNLYGVDMIAHVVEVKSDKPNAKIEVKNVQTLQTNFEDGGEGSGVDFQEIIRPFATQFPKKVGLQRNQNLKRIRVKDPKRKLNKSVKELDPNRWAEILAKANAKMIEATSTQKLTTQPLTTTTTTTTTMATTIFNAFTRQCHQDNLEVKIESIAPVLQIPPCQTTEPSILKMENTPEILTTTASPATQNKFYNEERRNSNIVPNRRRPPFVRRRPGRPRLRSNHFNRLVTTTTFPTTTTTTTTTTTATTTVASTTDSSAEYMIEEEDGDYYDEDIANEVMTTKLISTTKKNEITSTSLPNIFTIPMKRVEEKVEQSGWVTPTYSTRDSVRLTTQFRMPTKPIPLPKLVPNLQSEPKASPRIVPESKILTQHVVKVTEKPKLKAETDDYPIQMPVHPWLYRQDNRGGGETMKVEENKERSIGKDQEVKPLRPNQSPYVYPTVHWSQQQRPPPQPGPVYPIWPKTHSKAGSHLMPTRHPWLFQHPWVQAPFTNRPEITAETVRPTAPPTGNSGFNHHLPPVHHPNQPIIDQLFITRLRNRYRQAQLDRMAQLGKIVTPRPRTSYSKVPFVLTPRPFDPTIHGPYTLKYPSKYPPKYPPAPTASYSHTLPSPYGKSYFGFYPTSRSKYPTPLGVPYEGHWPIGGGRVSSRRPTAAPPFPWAVGAESGSKPRISPVSTASVSALAETDVLLPCKATGLPPPTIAWTKVSTGATIPASTKHGLRFEVFQNGSFLIKSVQLQDRGQYLCTAQNRFGSDRSVITLAVQTQPPKIQPPQSTEFSLYLGHSAALPCLASGRPTAQISWILPDRTFVRDVGAVHSILAPMVLFSNGTLQIHSANFSSKGDYKCIASNAAGADTVTYHVHVAALPPSISEKAIDTVIIQPGRSVFVHCSVRGEPTPSLKWTLSSGLSVKPSQFVGRRLFAFPNGTLYIKNVAASDAGRYECLATNPVGFAKRTIQIDVSADYPSFPAPPLPAPVPAPPPRHSTPSRLHSVTAMYGSAVYLHCPESTGSKRGTVWQLPSKTLLDYRYSPERPIRVFRNGTLRILQLTETDAGSYTCVFNRPNGEEVEMFQVEVLMTPPRIEHVRTAQTRVPYGENFQVDCVASGLPDPEVSWSLPDGTLVNNALQSDDSGTRQRRYIIFTNGTLLLHQIDKKDEGDYTCTAKNKLGTDERKVSVKVGPNAPQIKSKSQSLVVVRLGDSAKLSCEAIAEPAPRIMWISPRNAAIPALSDKYEILNNGMLVIKKVGLSDEGKYVCVARNSAGDDTKNVKVEIEQQAPSINGQKGKSYGKVMAVNYQTTLLDCKVESKPEPRIWWVTPYAQSFAVGYLGGRFQVHRNGSLELRGVRKNDEGRYSCFAKNLLGESTLTVEVEVASIAEKPSFAFPSIEIIPIKEDGGKVLLECPARGKPNPEFAWLLPNGTMLPPGVRLQRFHHYSNNGSLRISQPVQSDKGVYRCLAKNVAGQAEKRYALEAGRKPLIRGSGGGLKISYGQSLFLPCLSDGWPLPSVSWTLPNGVILDTPQTISRVTIFTNGTLLVRHVATFDKGTYTCRATNSYGTATVSYPVIVTVHPPRITSSLNAITRVSRGTPVSLSCVASGIPKPEISWTLPGRTTIFPHNRYTVQGGVHMTEEGSLVIQNPVLTNSGIYKCNAKNALGTDFRSTYLQVV